MPTTTVGALIIDSVDKPTKILLTQRNVAPFSGFWCLPGGHIDQYEQAESAVIREVKEETGLDFTPNFLYYFNEIFQKGNIHNIVLMFYGIVSGKIDKQESEVAEIKWFSFHEAVKYDLAFSHNKVLKYFMKKFQIILK